MRGDNCTLRTNIEKVIKNKKIILAVTGSIAAYKACFLLRLLKKEQADVRVLMTKSAADFVSPLTFSVLSEHPVISEFQEQQVWNNHVELGIWADIFLIAPATANTLAKMAQGICDNILLATYLSARCPILIAPAMDVDMFLHPATQKNINQLAAFGHTILPPETGELASGLVGVGRMMEPENIINYLKKDR